ncbi:hypothetical protein [Acidovorax temperans]
MTDKQDPIAHAARLLREAAEELRQSHTLSSDRNNWIGEPDAKAAYDDHLAAAQALEDWEAAVGAGGVSGPLMGRASLQSPGFDAADMATASAQGFRDGVASLSANAGEPVYQARYQKGFWQDSSRERCEYLQNPENTCAEDWETRILYTRPPTSAEGVEHG